MRHHEKYIVFFRDISEGENMKEGGLLQPIHPASSRIWTSAHAPVVCLQMCM